MQPWNCKGIFSLSKEIDHRKANRLIGKTRWYSIFVLIDLIDLID